VPRSGPELEIAAIAARGAADPAASLAIGHEIGAFVRLAAIGANYRFVRGGLQRVAGPVIGLVSLRARAEISSIGIATSMPPRNRRRSGVGFSLPVSFCVGVIFMAWSRRKPRTFQTCGGLPMGSPHLDGAAA
jgi:hypothetical protein